MASEVTLPWPAAIPQLKQLDELLRCGICYEYLNTPLVTLCSHNYCSLCIRQYLIYKTQCPACFRETTDHHLRNNRVLDEIVSLFPALRDKVARLNQASKGNSITGYLRPSQESAEECGGVERASSSRESCQPVTLSPRPLLPLRRTEEAVTPKSSRAKDKRFGSPLKREKAVPASPSASTPSSSSSSSSPFSQARARAPGLFGSQPPPVQPQIQPHSSPAQSQSRFFSIRAESSQQAGEGSEGSKKERVACPVCGVEVPAQSINLHLDSCLRRDTAAPPPTTPKRNRLPKLVYSLLSEKQIRQKLKEVGLPSHGPKPALVERHRKYTTLYNAECDRASPRPVREVAREVERQEHSLTRSIASIFTYDRKTPSNVIEVEQKKYLKKHNNQFADLINDIKKRQAEGKRKVVEKGGEEKRRRKSEEVSKREAEDDEVGTGMEVLTEEQHKEDGESRIKMETEEGTSRMAEEGKATKTESEEDGKRKRMSEEYEDRKRKSGGGKRKSGNYLEGGNRKPDYNTSYTNKDKHTDMGKQEECGENKGGNAPLANELPKETNTAIDTLKQSASPKLSPQKECNLLKGNLQENSANSEEESTATSQDSPAKRAGEEDRLLMNKVNQISVRESYTEEERGGAHTDTPKEEHTSTGSLGWKCGDIDSLEREKEHQNDTQVDTVMEEQVHPSPACSAPNGTSPPPQQDPDFFSFSENSGDSCSLLDDQPEFFSYVSAVPAHQPQPNSQEQQKQQNTQETEPSKESDASLPPSGQTVSTSQRSSCPASSPDPTLLANDTIRNAMTDEDFFAMLQEEEDVEWGGGRRYSTRSGQQRTHHLPRQTKKRTARPKKKKVLEEVNLSL